ncbi:pyridoxamine 5'-phosphate oxidase [Aliifodinibius salicampi]|uniref:Pyridoxamine 5'-phosphate oxidase n=1 Tax=Fodinibius salicampi TaxID=1920655 RepID=A0ABT3PY07_9BACT|nr:pyridoxamine 5'-phosphate oxidase [Fodinibius salicampi]MCW9712748.1 pyridoxamine 5'-phosphate oxidase [Fodinibius salicampi]
MVDSSSERQDIEQIRRDFAKEELSESTIEGNPIQQFSVWFDQALSSDLLDANAMTLSTVSKRGIPSSRIVLLKGVDEQGFRFYTNYKSRKGTELAENPHAALCFYWAPLERQVRIEGKVQKMNRDQSEIYFHKRPRLSQLGAWASQQSSKVESREKLETQFKEVKKQFEGEEVPLPDFWGGYRLIPDRIEFWQGRRGRLHDRICYERKNDGWEVFRLSP